MQTLNVAVAANGTQVLLNAIRTYGMRFLFAPSASGGVQYAYDGRLVLHYLDAGGNERTMPIRDASWIQFASDKSWIVSSDPTYAFSGVAISADLVAEASFVLPPGFNDYDYLQSVNTPTVAPVAASDQTFTGGIEIRPGAVELRAELHLAGDSTAQLFTSGRLSAWLYDQQVLQWARCPDWDLEIRESGRFAYSWGKMPSPWSDKSGNDAWRRWMAWINAAPDALVFGGGGGAGNSIFSLHQFIR